MLVRQTALPAYNVQTAVDAEHALIVAHAVVLDASDIQSQWLKLQSMHLSSRLST
jgi:hypothetical protein